MKENILQNVLLARQEMIRINTTIRFYVWGSKVNYFCYYKNYYKRFFKSTFLLINNSWWRFQRGVRKKSWMKILKHILIKAQISVHFWQFLLLLKYNNFTFFDYVINIYCTEFMKLSFIVWRYIVNNSILMFYFP